MVESLLFTCIFIFAGRIRYRMVRNGNLAGVRSDGPEPVGVGCICADGIRVAQHMGRQFTHPLVGLSQLQHLR